MRSGEPSHTIGGTARDAAQMRQQLLIALRPERVEHRTVCKAQSQGQLLHHDAGTVAARREYSITYPRPDSTDVARVTMVPSNSNCTGGKPIALYVRTPKRS